jgi:hypothetical protein
MPTPSDPLRAEIEALRNESDDWDDLTPVITEAIADGMEEGLARAKLATLPDSEPPSSGPPPVLSMGWDDDRHLRVRSGWLAALVVVVIGAVVAVWLTR